METIQEAKDFIFADENFKGKGSLCPCCGQNVRLYPRPIHASMARLLINLYRLDYRESTYYHVSQIFGVTKHYKNGSDDFAKFKVWGMIVQKPKQEGQKGRTSGYWRITEKGKQFVRGEIRVPSSAMMYNKKFYYFDESRYFDIRDALNKQFDYRELMGECYVEPAENGQVKLF